MLGKDSADWIKAVLGSRSKRVLVLVAELDGEIVGFTIAYKNRDLAYVDSIAVDESHRCKGIGKVLLEHLEKALLEKHVKTVYLSVKSWNTKALDFYLRNGYGVKGVVFLMHSSPGSIKTEYIPGYTVEDVEAGLVKRRGIKPVINWCNLVDDVDVSIYRKLYRAERAIVVKKNNKIKAFATYSVNGDLIVDSMYVASYNTLEALIVLLNAIKEIAVHSNVSSVEIPVDASKKNLVKILEECGLRVFESEYMLYKDLID